jgi:hypothetical protein
MTLWRTTQGRSGLDDPLHVVAVKHGGSPTRNGDDAPHRGEGDATPDWAK